MTVHSPLSGVDSQYLFYSGVSRWVWLAALSHAQRRAAPDLPWLGVVPNGINVAEYPYRDHKENFLLLGRLSSRKGVHLAIRAAQEADCRLVIAGSWTIPEERRYYDTAVRPHVGGKIEWVGSVGGEWRASLLSRAACVLFPVEWEEPFGLVMIEAMACGTPVVALRAGSVPEVVVDGQTGIVCDSPTELPESIDAAMHPWIPAIAERTSWITSVRISWSLATRTSIAGYSPPASRGMPT